MQNTQFLPGTHIPCPPLRKNITKLEAYHLCNYRVDGKPLGEYIYEVLLLMREIANPTVCNVIPVRDKNITNVFEAYSYAMHRFKYQYRCNILSVNLEEKQIVINPIYSTKHVVLCVNS